MKASRAFVLSVARRVIGVAPWVELHRFVGVTFALSGALIN
jgi:hypothetical protein